MVWIDTIEIGSPLAIDETVLEIIDINHTSLIAVLTESSIILLHQETFLPIAVNSRTPDSLKQHGHNIHIATKEFSVNYSALQNLSKVNIFCQTSLNYLIIYQISLDNTKSTYEVYDSNITSKTGGNVVIQKKLPTSYSNPRFLIQNIIKNVKNLISDSALNLENIEQFNNYQQEEDKLNQEIEYGKISIFKIIKIGIGIEKFWVKANSHNVFVYSNNSFQVINIKVLTNEIFKFEEFEWYTGGTISYIEHCKEGLFVFLNGLNELWGFNVVDLHPSGFKIGEIFDVECMKFNPVSDTILIYHDGGDRSLKLYKYASGSIKYIKTVEVLLGDFQSLDIKWSSDGEFFVVLNDQGYWMIVSKFGNVSVNTLNISSELNEQFLKGQNIMINSNCMSLNLINQGSIHKVNLLRLNNYQDLIMVNYNYLMILNNDSKLIKFPILPTFKNILTTFELNPLVNFKTSLNLHDQLIISFGNDISISTPIKTGNMINHVIWFNFRNYYMETLNIINHATYKHYLLLLNRSYKDVDNKSQLIDELIILNITDLRYGNGGNQIHFDSDLIIWRQKFVHKMLSFEVIDNNLIVLEDISYKVMVFTLSENITLNDKFYNFHIKLHKTIQLSNISTQQSPIDFNKVFRITLINLEDMIFLLRNGDLFLLKNQSNKILTTNYYQVVKINESVEFFKIDILKLSTNYIQYIYLFKGNSTLIYNLTNLIEMSFDQLVHITDGIEDIELPLLIQPIVVNYDNFQPLKILQSSKAISLIGLQDLIPTRNITKIKANNKLILNNLIEFDLMNNVDPEEINRKFGKFDNFNYCLELLLFKYLTNDDDLIKNLIKLVDTKLIVYINCLRKVEFNYWLKFFKTLGTTPVAMMHKLLQDNDNDVELCYSFLIIYLNSKKEEHDYGKLNHQDETIILEIMKLLDKEQRWDWCFELCRFVKLLDPNGALLRTIKQSIN